MDLIYDVELTPERLRELKKPAWEITQALYDKVNREKHLFLPQLIENQPTLSSPAERLCQVKIFHKDESTQIISVFMRPGNDSEDQIISNSFALNLPQEKCLLKQHINRWAEKNQTRAQN